MRPAIHPNIMVTPVTDGYVAYDPATDQLHELNPVAAFILELSNGTHTVEELQEIAQPLLPQNTTHEVQFWIEQAIEAGLLYDAEVTDRVSQIRPLSAQELDELADRLREAGKVQTAFLCQQRAVEQEPENTDLLRNLGELAHIVGRRDEAKAAYLRYCELIPDDAEVSHLLVALQDDSVPNRVPNACIEQLYERFSSFYESNMCDELGYEGPVHLESVITETLAARQDLNVLDLGCGTGLAAKRIRPRAQRLIGIDLSPEMVKLAEKSGTYDQLEVAEVTEFLERDDEQFDLIMACDCLIYFGDLRQVIEPARRRLRPGGVIAFSVERGEQPPFHLTDSGRYVHHLDHVEQVAQESGLVTLHRQAFLRMEYGREVQALYVTMRL